MEQWECEQKRRGGEGDEEEEDLEIIQQAQQQRRGKTIHYESFALHYINLSIDTKLKHNQNDKVKEKGRKKKQELRD